MRTELLTRAPNWNNKILTTRDVLNFYSRDDSFVFEKSKFSEDTTPLSDKKFYFFYHLLAQKILMFLAWCFGKKRDVFSVMFWKKRDVFRMIFWRKIDILVWCFEKKDIFDTLFKRIREGLRWKSWCFIMESKKLFHPLNYIFYHQL